MAEAAVNPAAQTVEAETRASAPGRILYCVLKRIHSDWYGDADDERAAIALVPEFALAHNNLENDYARLGMTKPR